MVSPLSVALPRRSARDLSGSFDLVKYSVSVSGEPLAPVFTRERKLGQKLSLKELVSHKEHGVDNTGNTRLWDSSSTLLYSMLFGTDSPFGILKGLGDGCEPMDVLELGAGMAGLTGLFLWKNRLHCNINNVVLTDGHPNCAFNNGVCVELNKCGEVTTADSSSSSSSPSSPSPPHKGKISCQKLLWKASLEGHRECQALVTETNCSRKFALILVSDCVHFQEFHGALVATIGRCLRVGGVAVLAQPERADSLENFVGLLRDKFPGTFSVDILTNYAEKMTEMHQKYLADEKLKGIYDPTIHFPKMLVLTMRREWQEEGADGEAARQFRYEKKLVEVN